MVVRIRLARLGGRNNPLYRIVVANNKTRRDGLPLESVGIYNPIPSPAGEKLVEICSNRVKYWLGVGAQPTSPVKKLLAKVCTNNVHYSNVVFTLRDESLTPFFLIFSATCSRKM
jgi:small subunit ribosomal protein S16